MKFKQGCRKTRLLLHDLVCCYRKHRCWFSDAGTVVLVLVCRCLLLGDARAGLQVSTTNVAGCCVVISYLPRGGVRRPEVILKSF